MFANIASRAIKPHQLSRASHCSRLRLTSNAYKMSLWFRPASFFPRVVEEAMRDFRQMERMMFTPLSQIPIEGMSAEQVTGETVNDDKKFSVAIDVSRFKPENLKVNLDGHKLTIEGKQEVKEENGYSMRSFVRSWVLPENVDLEALKSSLSDNGRLSIEAPKIQKPEPETGRSIPIERVSNAKPVTEK
ncbi:unnamed protein product [Cylicocyclus nassatus]|uniref:SHSP domain-containing protein n=1 Tax=Cylicocyclus nassatus TaxID=53992 RepID=A0AA36GRT4_CYLNA|nr:unnamed protein product [Cylicocyclus nassatus]